MGVTLSRAAHWTSVEGMKGKLEFSSINEYILNEITQFAAEFASKNAAEGNYVFNKPLEWTTDCLTLTMFGGNNYITNSDGSVESTEKGTFLARKHDNKSIHLTVSTFAHCCNILNMAKDKRLSETRSCLENNMDPVAKILGDAYATVDRKDNTMNRLVDQMLNQDSVSDDKRSELKIYIELDQLDKQLLNESLKKISEEIRITPVAINEEIKLLAGYSGDDESKCILKSIDHVSGIEFNNGCRASSWRQMHGDITYLLIECFDSDLLYVTCNRSGVYENNQITSEKETNYERVGETYNDLISLLKVKSEVFKQNLANIDFKLYNERRQFSRSFDANENQNEAKQEEAEEKVKSQEDQTDQHKEKKREETRDWSNISNIKELKKNMEKQKSQLDRPKSMSGQSVSKFSIQYKENSSGESSPESDGEDDLQDRGRQDQNDLPSEYWQIQKLVKYLKGGNQTATIIALCSMRDFNLTQEACQFAIRDVGGLEVLINLLDTEDIKCKIGSLQILKEISINPYIRRSIADLGGLQTMVSILTEQDKDLRCLAAETIANVAKFKRARKVVRQNGGIKRLVALLEGIRTTPHSAYNQVELTKDVEVARCGASALWSLSKSKKNKHEMRRAGVIPLLASLLKSPHESMCIPVVGTLQECASEPSYRLAIRTEGMIEDLVKNLKSSNEELQMHCANAIFKCAEDKDTRDLIRKYGGLEPLAKLIQNKENKPLLAAATGAIWKCSISKENVNIFKNLKTIESLVQLLQDPTEEVLINAVGAIAECAQEADNRASMRKAGGVSPLVNLLTGTNNQLLVNTCKALAQCALDSENISIIERMDGVRLLWSLLKNSNPKVQASAAWAICPCIKNIRDSGETVRNFVGGLELIVSLLKSPEIDVLASVCAAIAEIAKDEENLAVITDHGVVPMLASLTYTNDETLRRYLTEAIAQCCKWGKNRELFGQNGAVSPLVKYLKSTNTDVHTSTAKALHQLSKNPDNCIAMHEHGVVRLLLGMVGSSDEVLQENAAGCISYIRRLALANEKFRHA